ncbi:cold-shock protein [Pseudomonas monteilii]|uniref:Cold-shock protein n=1 Tax=Pseudomonas monteilii TaxID=76759 RepID=A0AAE6R7V8_9PSED|nr:cold-shock protein [Pseudomonas monteilii]
MHSRQEGTVKWFDEKRGIGVISAEGRRRDYLVLRCAAVNVVLSKGERVLLEPVSEALGCWAFNVAKAHH